MSPAAVGSPSINSCLSKKSASHARTATGRGRGRKNGAKTWAMARHDEGSWRRWSRPAFVGGAAARRRGEREGGVATRDNNNLLSVLRISGTTVDGVRRRASLLAGTQGWDEADEQKAGGGYNAVDDVDDEEAQSAVTRDVGVSERVKGDTGERMQKLFLSQLTSRLPCSIAHYCAGFTEYVKI